MAVQVSILMNDCIHHSMLVLERRERERDRKKMSWLTGCCSPSRRVGYTWWQKADRMISSRSTRGLLVSVASWTARDCRLCTLRRNRAIGGVRSKQGMSVFANTAFTVTCWLIIPSNPRCRRKHAVLTTSCLKSTVSKRYVVFVCLHTHRSYSWSRHVCGGYNVRSDNVDVSYRGESTKK